MTRLAKILAFLGSALSLIAVIAALATPARQPLAWDEAEDGVDQADPYLEGLIG